MYQNEGDDGHSVPSVVSVMAVERRRSPRVLVIPTLYIAHRSSVDQALRSASES
jgi:hypothetical protein